MVKSLIYWTFLTALVNAITTVETQNPNVVRYSTRRKPYVADPVGRDRMRKRAATVQLSLSNDITLYLANVSLGTPEQNLELHIDTGSSDLWVNTASSATCTQYRQVCERFGVYSANSSSTYKYLDSDFSISYVDGSGASGDYVTDTLHFGENALTGFQFGIGYTSSSEEGIMGIGYGTNEVSVGNSGSLASTYPNLPVALRNAGFTNSVAYALWLNDLDASTGSILFGGVDTAKFHAPLYTIPIIREYGVYAQFIIALTAIGENGNVGSIASDQAIPVLLDSGSSLTYLPDNIVDSMFSAFGAQYNSRIGAGVVNCDLANSNTTIDFTFSDAAATISVPMNELVIGSVDSNGQQYCILGIAPTGNSNPVLGDTFLRSAYVVYDLQSNTISLGQTNFDGADSNIEEIADSSAATAVPGATTVSNPVTTVASQATGIIGRIGVTGNAAAAQITAPPVSDMAAIAFALGALWAI